MPNKVKKSLESGKKLKDKWDENKLNFMIYNCINIEKNINDIKLINDSIEKSKDADKNFHLKYEEKNFEDEINDLLQIIKYFATENKLNIFIKQKEKEKENIELKEKIKQITYINDYIVKNKLSEFYTSKIPFNIISRCNKKKCLDTTGVGLNESPHLWSNYNNENQVFKLIKNDNETYYIKNEHHGIFIGMELLNEKWKLINRKKGENYQKFKIIYSGEEDYFLFLNEKGKIIDLINNKTEDGSKIEPNDISFSRGQQWKLVKCG